MRTKSSTTTPPVPSLDVLEQSALQAAKKQFVSATVGMGWRLAIAVLLPIVVGVKLDHHFHTSPAYTLIAFMGATIASVLIVRDAMRDLNRQQTGMPPVTTSSKEKPHDD